MQGIPHGWGSGKMRPAMERWPEEVSRAIRPRIRPTRAWRIPGGSRPSEGHCVEDDSGAVRRHGAATTPCHNTSAQERTSRSPGTRSKWASRLNSSAPCSMLQATGGDPEVVAGNRRALLPQAAVDQGIGIGGLQAHGDQLHRIHRQEATQLLAVARLPIPAGETRQQFSQNGAADQQPSGLAEQLHTDRLTALEAHVGVGIKGDRSHRSTPKIGIHLPKRRNRRLEAFGLLLAPGAGQGIEHRRASDRRGRGLIDQAPQGEAIHADALALGLLLQGRQVVAPQPPHRDGRHQCQLIVLAC